MAAKRKIKACVEKDKVGYLLAFFCNLLYAAEIDIDDECGCVMFAESFSRRVQVSVQFVGDGGQCLVGSVRALCSRAEMAQ